MFSDHSFKYKTTGDQKRKLCSLTKKNKDQHVVLEK